MKLFTLALLTLLTTSLYAQDTTFDGHKWAAPYGLPTPKDWGIERFLLPAAFAPEIKYKGVEDIRFTPGWGKADSDEYWSYAFLWYLDGEVKFNAATIASDLRNYYKGLISVNGQNIPAEKIIPVETSFKEINKEKDDLRTFTGTISMTDYMQQKPITLHCKAHVIPCPSKNKTFIFYELSPQPVSHTVWQRLGQLRTGFKCTSN